MQAQFNQAQSLHQAGSFQQAEAIYRQLLQHEVSHPIVNARLAQLLHQTNQNQDNSFNQLFQRADKALYQAKAQGRNQVIIAKP